MKRTIFYLMLTILPFAQHGVGAVNIDALGEEVREKFERAIETTNGLLASNQSATRAARSLQEFYTKYYDVAKSGSRLIKDLLRDKDVRTHHLIEACRVGIDAFQSTNPAAARNFSNTEKDVIQAIYQLKGGNAANANKLCKKVAQRGRTATYNDYTSPGGLSLKFSRAISCAACTPTFIGQGTEENREHPNASRVSCSEAHKIPAK